MHDDFNYEATEKKRNHVKCQARERTRNAFQRDSRVNTFPPANKLRQIGNNTRGEVGKEKRRSDSVIVRGSSASHA